MLCVCAQQVRSSYGLMQAAAFAQAERDELKKGNERINRVPGSVKGSGTSGSESILQHPRGVVATFRLPGISHLRLIRCTNKSHRETPKSFATLA